MFATLPPGAKLVRHRDPYAGSYRYHLGLDTPNDDGCYIDVDGEKYAWRDGEGVIFDETYIHYAANTTEHNRIILFCDVERPLKYRWATAFNRWFSRNVMAAAAAPNDASDKTGGGNIGPAAAAGALAAFLYGVGANLVPRWFAGLPPVGVAAATLLSASLLTLPLAIAHWPATPVSLPAWGSAVAVGVLSTGFAYALYYRLIQRVGAARAVTVTYLVPLAAVAWAWGLLGEALTWPMGIACGLILGSVAISQRSR